MPYPTLIVDSKEAKVAVIRLNRPEAANALNQQMGKELAAAFTARGKTARVIILTGEGRHFCAGADLKERQNIGRKAWGAQHAAFERGLKAILNCPIPVIAAVNGTAMGGGLELALACDFIIAAAQARFAFPESGLGIMPGLGGTQTFPRAVGTRYAKERLFTATPFSAEEAYRIGMVNHLYPQATLMQEAHALAAAIAERAPKSIRAIKKAVDRGIAQPLAAGLSTELTLYKSLLSTRDRHEGINAFNEKRTPVFTGN